MSILDAFLEVQWRELLDVALVALLFWVLITWLRRTRARLALVGLVILGGIYLLARVFELQLTAWMLQGFFAVFVVVLVVVFQEDLRRLFEQIALWGLRRTPPPAPAGALDVLARTLVRLATNRTGALVVLPGREPLERHVEGGIVLDARLSEPLLLSLFDTHSPGHDGAVIVTGDRVVRFAVHLPLSSDRRQLGPGGTRHAAGLGLAERADALCIVVSEERGTISVARDGRLRVLRRPESVLAEMQRFREETAASGAAPTSLWRGAAAGWRDALPAVLVAAVVWALVVPGSTVTEVTRSAPVVVENLPQGWMLEHVEPAEVLVSLEGTRRDLVFGDRSAVEVPIDALLVKLGRRTFAIDPMEVRHPPDLRVTGVDPDQVKLSVRRQDEAPAGGAPPAR